MSLDRRATLAASSHLGYRHPIYVGTTEPVVMTVDGVLTLQKGATKARAEAVSYRYISVLAVQVCRVTPVAVRTDAASMFGGRSARRAANTLAWASRGQTRQSAATSEASYNEDRGRRAACAPVRKSGSTRSTSDRPVCRQRLRSPAAGASAWATCQWPQPPARPRQTCTGLVLRRIGSPIAIPPTSSARACAEPGAASVLQHQLPAPMILSSLSIKAK